MSSNTLAAAPAPNTTGTVNVAPRRSKRAIIREEQYNNQSRRRQRQNEPIEPEEIIARGTRHNKGRKLRSRKLRKSRRSRKSRHTRRY